MREAFWGRYAHMTMRAHRLDELAIRGREKALALEPELDLYRARRVVRLELQFVNLELDLTDPPLSIASFEPLC